MEATHQLPAIDTIVLTPLVRQSLGRRAAALVDWRTTQIVGGMGEGLGVFRIAGQAVDQDERMAWSLILKVLGPGAGAEEPGAWNYWKREVLAYQSGLLTNSLGSVSAPRCFAVTEHADRQVWLWLEDIVEPDGAPWLLADYGRAAHRFGQFHGAYLRGRPIDDAWLSRGWLQHFVETSTEAVEQLRQEMAQPWVRRANPGDLGERVLKLWHDRSSYLAVLPRLPQTLCHMDVFRRNLLMHTHADGSQRLYAIDWAFTGIGAIGEELAPLIIGSVGFMEVERAQLLELEEHVLTGYWEGLASAGWRGDPRHVRLGYAVAGALRYSLGALKISLPLLLDERLHPMIEQVFGHPMTGICECWATCTRHAIRLADEALQLAQQLDLA